MTRALVEIRGWLLCQLPTRTLIPHHWDLAAYQRTPCQQKEQGTTMKLQDLETCTHHPCNMYQGCRHQGAFGGFSPPPPDFRAQYALYIGLRVFVVHKVPTKVERFYKSSQLCRALQLYVYIVLHPRAVNLSMNIIKAKIFCVLHEQLSQSP